MGTFSIWHWIIVLAIVVLVFGTKKLRNLGSDLGSALKGFKDGMKESETDNTSFQSTNVNDQIIEVEARKETSSNTFKEHTKEEHRAPINTPIPSMQANKTTSEATTYASKESKQTTETEKSASQPISVNSQIVDAEFKGNTQAKA